MATHLREPINPELDLLWRLTVYNIYIYIYILYIYMQLREPINSELDLLWRLTVYIYRLSLSLSLTLSLSIYTYLLILIDSASLSVMNEQAEAGRDGRTCLAMGPNSQARTRTVKYSLFSPFS